MKTLFCAAKSFAVLFCLCLCVFSCSDAPQYEGPNFADFSQKNMSLNGLWVLTDYTKDSATGKVAFYLQDQNKISVMKCVKGRDGVWEQDGGPFAATFKSFKVQSQAFAKIFGEKINQAEFMSMQELEGKLKVGNDTYKIERAFWVKSTEKIDNSDVDVWTLAVDEINVDEYKQSVHENYIVRKGKLAFPNPIKSENFNSGVSFKIKMNCVGANADALLTWCTTSTTNKNYNAFAIMEAGGVRYISNATDEKATSDWGAVAQGVGERTMYFTANSTEAKHYITNAENELFIKKSREVAANKSYCWNTLKNLLATADTVGIDLGFSSWKSGYIDNGSCIKSLKIYNTVLKPSYKDKDTDQNKDLWVGLGGENYLDVISVKINGKEQNGLAKNNFKPSGWNAVNEAITVHLNTNDYVEYTFRQQAPAREKNTWETWALFLYDDENAQNANGVYLRGDEWANNCWGAGFADALVEGLFDCHPAYTYENSNNSASISAELDKSDLVVLKITYCGGTKIKIEQTINEKKSFSTGTGANDYLKKQ